MRSDKRAGLMLGTCSLLISACGLVGGGSDDETSSPPATEPSGGSSDAFAASCTGDGDVTLSGSAERTVNDVPATDGAVLKVALGSISSQADPPTALLYVSELGETGRTPEDVSGIVGDELAYESWTVTIRSVCQDSVGIDVTA